MEAHYAPWIDISPAVGTCAPSSQRYNHTPLLIVSPAPEAISAAVDKAVSGPQGVISQL
jgi:hypothetical protein